MRKSKLNLRVLILDDNRDAANTLGRLLRGWGCETYTSYDGLEALHAAPTFKPHAILLDIEMPRLHGGEVARMLRQASPGGAAFIVAITGTAHNDYRFQEYAGAFDAYLAKPCDLDELHEMLEALGQTAGNGQ